ncbi:MAG: hypothetical protein E7645_08785 [Ruminococcaceae bacterium]|nr:hypothetical protein [Oscillospiraceae bacterium]
MASTYKTEGKTRLIEFFSGHPDIQYTADQLHTALEEAYPEAYTGKSTGKSSLYRQLSGLIEEGTVRKFRDDTQSAYVYQYVACGACSHHFHLKCLSCGKLEHLDCVISDQLLTHISVDHNFCIDRGRSILYGLCADCHRKENPPVNIPLCPCGHKHD